MCLLFRGKIIVVFVSIIISLTAIELFVAYLPIYNRADYYSPGLSYNHPIHGYQSTPNSAGYYERADFVNMLQYNNYGRHDYDVKNKGRKNRIATLGGSFTAGLEVPIDHTWPKILEKRLGEQWDVLNFAHQAKMFNYFARYVDDDFLSKIQPDYLMFGFAYNRLSGGVHYDESEMSCQRALNYKGFSCLYGPHDKRRVIEVVERLRSFTYFPFMLYENLPEFRNFKILNLLVQRQGSRFNKTFPESNGPYINGNVISILSCNKSRDISNTINDIMIIKEACRKYSVPVLFFFIPSETDIVNNSSAKQGIPLFFSQNDFVIDLFDDLKSDYSVRRKPLYWKHDGHPNAEGYKIIGESIHRHFSHWLKEKALGEESS